jgi:hypothetical protein
MLLKNHRVVSLVGQRPKSMVYNKYHHSGKEATLNNRFGTSRARFHAPLLRGPGPSTDNAERHGSFLSHTSFVDFCRRVVVVVTLFWEATTHNDAHPLLRTSANATPLRVARKEAKTHPHHRDATRGAVRHARTAGPRVCRAHSTKD